MSLLLIISSLFNDPAPQTENWISEVVSKEKRWDRGICCQPACLRRDQIPSRSPPSSASELPSNATRIAVKCRQNFRQMASDFASNDQIMGIVIILMIPILIKIGPFDYVREMLYNKNNIPVRHRKAVFMVQTIHALHYGGKTLREFNKVDLGKLRLHTLRVWLFNFIFFSWLVFANRNAYAEMLEQWMS